MTYNVHWARHSIYMRIKIRYAVSLEVIVPHMYSSLFSVLQLKMYFQQKSGWSHGIHTSVIIQSINFKGIRLIIFRIIYCCCLWLFILLITKYSCTVTNKMWHETNIFLVTIDRLFFQRKFIIYWFEYNKRRVYKTQITIAISVALRNSYKSLWWTKTVNNKWNCLKWSTSHSS